MKTVIASALIAAAAMASSPAMAAPDKPGARLPKIQIASVLKAQKAQERIEMQAIIQKKRIAMRAELAKAHAEKGAPCDEQKECPEEQGTCKMCDRKEAECKTCDECEGTECVDNT